MDRYRFDERVFSALEASPVPFAVYQFIDKRVVTLLLSEGFCAMLGYTDRQRAYDDMDSDMYRLTHPDDEARVADAALRFAAEGGEYNVVYRSKTAAGGDYIVVHARGRHVLTETGVRLAYVWYTNEGAFAGESEIKGDELTRSFSHMLREGSRMHHSRYDAMTGLPNMAYFFDLAEAGRKRMTAAGKTCAILFANLSGMKAFNNKWGFAEGDRLLRAFGHLMAARFSNENCARIGQDHFTVYTEADGLEERLASLFEACKALNDGKTLPVQVGVYLVESEAVEIGKACDRAKMACDMKRKHRESGFAYFDSAMLAEAENWQYVVDNLDRALKEQWIQVYYQPIIRAANGRVCDEEALARWIDPVKGMLSPAAFIPALEETKLIYKLDLYVVERVLKKMKKQAEAGLYVVPQSVNLSRADFETCDIVEEIRRRVDEAGIPRDKLTVEITESIVGNDFAFMKTQVERFHALGFPVWMDDFGSGYSSLDVLQNIRFDLIKFDMRFMQQLDSGEQGKIILTELVKMAIGLGVDTVCEGVESESQVEFLKEIGCTKLQGFYYCRPIPLEGIVERNRKGIQIGFENPAESDYYATLGRINLYDMGVLAGDGEETFSRYFDTVPMALMEINGTWAKYIRCNRSYRDFMMRVFGVAFAATPMDYSQMPDVPGAAFMRSVMRCSRDGSRAIVDEKVGENATVHSFVRRMAVNPVTGTSAVAIAVLAVMEESGSKGISYAGIARALSADYVFLYYVNLETEEFIEYRSDAIREDLAMERHGGDFFAASRRDARQMLYKDDQEYFVQSFTKENVTRVMDAKGTFTVSYRLVLDGKPTFVNMKAVRMPGDKNHMIIGVNNVDAQMRHQEMMDRVQAEQIAYSRMAALNGDYLAIYLVDPETGRYSVYSAAPPYERLGLPKAGEDFFAQAHKDGARAVCPDDRPLFLAQFTRENVLETIARDGLFVLRHRLMIGGKPRYVSVKAGMAQEQDGRKLIVGVSSIDAYVRREMEREKRINAAKKKAE